jgi:hypothetical protein
LAAGDSGTLNLIYVSGMLMCPLDAEVTNSSLKQDVILTSHNWPIIVNFDLTAYENATTTLRKDLAGVGEIARRSATIGELRHFGTALNSMENKLRDLKDFCLK